MSLSATSALSIGFLQTRAAIGLSTGADAAASATSAAPPPSAREEFDKFAAMSPAERMRAAILQQMGVSEDQLAAMSPSEAKAMEDKIADKVKEMVQETAKTTGKTGLLADIRA